MLKHFVLSRLGLGVYCDQRLKEQIDLFEAVTFSSLANQSSQEFEFLLVTDVGLRGELHTRLHALMQKKRNFHLISIDTTRMQHMHLGQLSWMYEPCRDYLLTSRLISDPTQFVLTSAIDSDDAWHRHYISSINSVARERLNELVASEPARATYVGHSAGLAITQQNGLKLFLPTKATEPMASQFHSTTVSILARFSSGVSAWSSRHIAWPYMAYILMFETVNIETAKPMWLYVRHHNNVQPWDARNLEPAVDEKLLEMQREFGIDLKRLDEWIGLYCSDSSLDDGRHSHSGRPFRDQVDLMYQVAALNDQIMLLERQLDTAPCDPGEKEEIGQLLRQQKLKRGACLQRMRAAGACDAFAE